jgi:signal transduction histidine kinase
MLDLAQASAAWRRRCESNVTAPAHGASALKSRGVSLRKATLVIAVLVATLWPGAASAIDPSRSLAQLQHRRWTIEDHAPTGIRAIVQSADGYLLLGASDGVYRFDGVSFELLSRPGHALENNAVTSLMLRGSDEVWVNYDSGPIGVYRDGKFTDLPGDHPVGLALEAREDAQGDVWFGLYSSDAALARYSNGRWQAVGDESSLNAEPVYDLVATTDGVLWVMTAHTLQFLRNGDTRFQPTGEFFPRGAALAQDTRDGLWISDNYRGTRRLPDYLHGAAAPVAPKGALPVVEQAVRQIIVDRDGAVWGATQSRGIFRVPEPGAATAPAGEQVFGFKEGLTSDIAYTVFEDREGNIWVGTTTGLDQFRVSNIVAEHAVPPRSYFGYTLFNSEAGALYVADSSSLYSIDGAAAPRMLGSGFVHPQTLCEGADGRVFLTMNDDMVEWDGGVLTHVQLPPDHVDFEGCARDSKGALWFTVGTQGVMRLDDKNWQRFPLPDRRNEWAGAIEATPDGVIAYFNTKGLVRLDTQPWQPVADEKELGIGQIATLQQSPGGLLIGGRYGLARLQGGTIQRISSQGHSWLESVQGIAQATSGDTWLLGAKGLVRIPTRSLEAAFTASAAPSEFELFDMNDGLPGPVGAMGNVHDVLSIGPDGRIWFTTTEGLAWLDPFNLARNSLVPPVSIASLVANGQQHANPREMQLREGVTNLAISYTALSLSVPERVRFRYRLEGVDHEWVEAGTRREAFYTKLGPGSYRFRVIAANNDGVWNEAGASLAFTIPPTFLQSRLFFGLCLLVAALVLWSLYTLRVKQVSRQMQHRLDERLAERERIARELHDTLLQGFQGLVLRFQAAALSIPVSHDARRMMEVALDQADTVIVEGRDRVHDLRTADTSGDLAECLSEAVKRFAPDGTRITIREEGATRRLSPTVLEEVLRIGVEGVANAVRHSGASVIDIDLAYMSRHLRLSIRDNGVGIDPETIVAGRTGHFGIVGMRERAHGIRARFAILSRPSAGAEVVLTVPASIAYDDERPFIWALILRCLPRALTMT